MGRCLQEGQRWGPYRGRTQVPALPGVGREVIQHEVPQGTVEVLACGRWVVSSPGHRLPGLLTAGAHPVCSPPKTANSPGEDRKAPAAPTRAEKAGSPALTLCHQPAPWFSLRCRSQARPKKPGSHWHGPRGWGERDTGRGQSQRKRQEEERQSQSETRRAETEERQMNRKRKNGKK